LNNLSTLAVSSAGVFSDTQSYYWQTLQQALYPQFATVSPVPIGGLTLSNGLSRTQTANISFVHTDDRNTYTLSLFGQLQTQLSVPALIGQANCLISQPSSFTQSNCANSSLAGARLSVSRNLRRDLTGFAAVSYSLSNEFGGNDRTFEVDAGLNYLLSPKTSAYVSAQYLQNQSNGQSFFGGAPFGGVPQQATVMVGIRYRLGSTPTP
jgi:predicted porin